MCCRVSNVLRLTQFECAIDPSYAFATARKHCVDVRNGKNRPKLAKYRKLGSLVLRTMTLINVLKAKSLTEDVSGFRVGRAVIPYYLDPMQVLIHSFFKVSGYYLF